MRQQARRERRGLRGMFGLGALFGAGGALVNEARQALDHANQLFDDGKYNQAGDALSELAELAQGHNRPRRAAQMFYRAYDAYLKAGDVTEAIEQARHTIDIASTAKPMKAIRLAQNVIAELKAAGFTKEAEEFAKEMNQRLGQHGLSLAATEAATPATPKQRASNCSKCGARLRWMDDDEVECEYCGTITYS